MVEPIRMVVELRPAERGGYVVNFYEYSAGWLREFPVTVFARDLRQLFSHVNAQIRRRLADH